MYKSSKKVCLCYINKDISFKLIHCILSKDCLQRTTLNVRLTQLANQRGKLLINVD